MSKTPMERWRKWRETHDRKRQEQRYNADAYQRRVQQGRCGHCGAARPEGYEYATCAACRQKCKIAQELRRASFKDLEAPDADERAPTALLRCPRCSLVEPHECMKASAEDRRPW